MSKSRRSERVPLPLTRRSLAVLIALGAAGVFSIAVSEPSRAEAQTYYGNQQGDSGSVVLRNPRYYGPNADSPGSDNAPTDNDGGFNSTPAYGAGNGVGYGVRNSYGSGWGNSGYNPGWGNRGYNPGWGNRGYNPGWGNRGYNTGWGNNGYDVGDGDGYADDETLRRAPGSGQVIFTNPNLSSSARADIVPQGDVAQQSAGDANQRMCMWSDGKWRPEAIRTTAWSSWSGSRRLYCQGDSPTPAYCWAMGFGVCPPGAYFPAYYGYYPPASNEGEGRRLDGPLEQPQEAQPELSITPAQPGAPPP